MCEKKVVLKIAVQTFEDGDFFTFSSGFGVFETHFLKKIFLKRNVHFCNRVVCKQGSRRQNQLRWKLEAVNY